MQRGAKARAGQVGDSLESMLTPTRSVNEDANLTLVHTSGWCESPAHNNR